MMSSRILNREKIAYKLLYIRDNTFLESTYLKYVFCNDLILV